MLVEIRGIRGDDAPAIAQILIRLGWFKDLIGESKGETTERISGLVEATEKSDCNEIYVAEAPGNVQAGYIFVHWVPCFFLKGPEGYITDLFIADEHRGDGYGNKLIRHVMELAREKGCSRLMIINDRKRESYKRRFYEKLGWEERESISNFIYEF